METSNKEKLRYLLERKIESLLEQAPVLASSLVDGLLPNAPALKPMIINIINAKIEQYTPKIQPYCDLLVDMATLDPEGTLETYIKNAETLLNEAITNALSKYTNLSPGFVQLSLIALFGDSITKL